MLQCDTPIQHLMLSANQGGIGSHFGDPISTSRSQDRASNNKTIELVIISSTVTIFSARDRDVLLPLLLITLFHIIIAAHLDEHILMKAGTAKDQVWTKTL